MTRPIHYSTYGSHHDVGMACGLSGWYWDDQALPDGETAIEDVHACDVGEERCALRFTSTPQLVTCAACLPKATLDIERRAASAARVAAAGGIEAFVAQVRAKVAARRGGDALGLFQPDEGSS